MGHRTKWVIAVVALLATVFMAVSEGADARRRPCRRRPRGCRPRPVAPVPPAPVPVDPGNVVVFEGSGFAIPDRGVSTNAVTVEVGVKRVTDVDVRLRGLRHERVDDVDAFLTAPDGRVATLLADTGSGSSASGLALTLDDEASTSIPRTGPVSSGAYRPTSYGPTGNFVGQQPPATLRTFDGARASGTWTLNVVDDLTGGTGSLTGWTLQLEVEDATPPVIVPIDPPPGNADTQVFTNSTPFRIEDHDVVASSIDVPDFGRPIADVDVRFDGLIHTAIQDLDIKLTNPSEVREVVLMSDVGSGPVTDITFDLDDEASASLPTSGPIAHNGRYRPRNIGTDDAFFSPDVLSEFDTGGHAGRWILTISDDEAADVGSLRSWSLIITFA